MLRDVLVRCSDGNINAKKMNSTTAFLHEMITDADSIKQSDFMSRFVIELLYYCASWVQICTEGKSVERFCKQTKQRDKTGEPQIFKVCRFMADLTLLTF